MLTIINNSHALERTQNGSLKSLLFNLNFEANIVRKEVYAINATFPEKDEKIAEAQISKSSEIIPASDRV